MENRLTSTLESQPLIFHLILNS